MFWFAIKSVWSNNDEHVHYTSEFFKIYYYSYVCVELYVTQMCVTTYLKCLGPLRILKDYQILF